MMDDAVWARSRRRYAWLAFAGVVFAVVGSLVPFQFEWLPPAQAGGRFVRELWRNVGMSSLSDVAANVLLMLPIAFCAAGALERPAGRRGAIAIVLGLSAAGAVFSCAIEFVQTFLPARVVSLRDVVAESVGCAFGAVLWLAAGRTFTDALRRQFSGRERLSGPERWLLGYACAVALWQLRPLDLSLEPSMIFHKYRDGRLLLGLTWDSDWHSVATRLRDILIYMPLGAVAVRCWRPAGCRRGLPVAIAVGTAAVAAIQISHVFVESRAIESQTFLAGSVGVALGVGATTGFWL
jgi:hypothetical protein